MYELEESDFTAVLPLFKEVHLDFVIQSVVKGNHPARIWVDDHNPQTAFMWNKGSYYYLVGDEKNHEFNRGVKTLFTTTITPEAVDNFSVFKVHYTEGWEQKINHIIERPLVKRDRHLYTLYTSGNTKTDWKSKVPPGSSVEYIDKDLLESGLKNIKYVKEEIESMWNSLHDFYCNGFGFCSVLNDVIVSWCTVEFVSDTACGIGIETVKGYQNQGFATVTASAFVEHCISKNITPFWDSWSDNAPSIRVAEKAGFIKAVDFAVYFGSFIDYESYLIQGDHYYRQKKYDKAAADYERALTIKESGRLYYETACTYALAGKKDKALKTLKKAVQEGADRDIMRNDDRLTGLHNTEEWQGLMG
jgi:RimJ/RimL family protein N-acetyltransferase